MAGKAQLPKTSVDEIVKANSERKKQFGRERSLFAGIPQLLAVNGIGVSHKSTGGIISTIQGLPTAGGPMIGPIAFHPRTVGIVSGVLDVGKTTTAFSSRVIVLGQANPDNLVRITGAAHAGQILFLQAVSTTAIVLKHLTAEGSAVGNIYMPSGSDYTVAGKEIVLLQWDTINPPAGTEYGQWTLVATSGSDSANKTLSNLTDPTTINANLEPDNNAGHADERDLGHEDKIWARAYIKDVYNTGTGAGYSELFGVIAGSGETQTHPSYKTVATDASPADNDMVGALGFDGYNSATERLTWARMVGVSDVVTDSAETAHFEFKTLQSGTEKTMLETDQFGIYLSNDMSGGSSPAYNGALYRDGNDIKCYTGGAEKSLSDIGSSGASTALDNLTDPTSINQHLIPENNSKDLGSSTTEWRNLYVGIAAYLDHVSMGGSIDCNDNSILDASKVEFCNGATDVTADVTGISSTAGGVMELNVASSSIFNFKVNDVTVASLTSSVFSHDNIILNNSFVINNSSTNPTANGEFTRNGNDVKVFTGGVLKSLTDIGSGGGSGADTDLGNLTTTSINQSLIPSINNSKELGSSSKQWNRLWVNELLPVSVNGSLIPTTENFDLGSASKLWIYCWLKYPNLGESAANLININGKLGFNNNTTTFTSDGTPTGKIQVLTAAGTKYIYTYDS